MTEKYFDINTVPVSGFIVFPLSMTRLANAFSPQKIYEFLEFFEEKLVAKTVDVILLYTNDLYLNSEENSTHLRKKILNQMLNHKSAFESLLLSKKRFFPGAFQYLPWDYSLLNASNFNAERARLHTCMNTDPLFKAALLQDLQVAEREPTESNINFLIEELVVSHLIMEKEVTFSPRLATVDGWRLLCYPGNPPFGLVYLWQKNLLGNRTDMPKPHQLFSRSFYNMESRVLIDFKHVLIEKEMLMSPEIVKI